MGTADPGSGPEATEGPLSEERLSLADWASDIGAFEVDVASGQMRCTPPVAALFGFDPQVPRPSLADWESAIFVDDIPKLRAAFAAAPETGAVAVEFRVKHPDGSVHWLRGRGGSVPANGGAHRIRGTLHDITDRKALESRLLALNETLEDRVTEVREESRTLEVLNQTCIAVAAELDLERLVQLVTDAGVELTQAEFGAFFHKMVGESGEAYTLHTLSGASRDSFVKFPMPRNTAVFGSTGQGVVRSFDILADPRFGRNPPYSEMPDGPLPVRSYLAVPVVARTGDVLGGLFFGHTQPGIFTPRAELIAKGIAGQAAVAIDNARLFQSSQREVLARQQAEQELQSIVGSLEERVAERAGQLAASASKLEQAERVFRLLVEAVTDYAIYMLEPSGNIASWNPGASRIKGYTREEAVGQNFEIFYTEPERREGIPQRAMDVAARAGKYESEGWRVRKDGSEFWASVVLSAIRDAEGQLLGFAKITRDLTERRAAEERLRQAQKMEAIGQLTGGVAHDFNNLLMVILGNLETLQRQIRQPGPDIPRLERSTENAMGGARRAEALTQRLLAFSRQQPLDPKPIDVGRLISGMSDLLRRTIGEQIAVETILAGGLWLGHADPNQLEVAIINLAVNSRDAMPEGGKLTIETVNVYLDERYAAGQADVSPGQYVLVAISDNGSGMTPDVLDRAFDPFYTTKGIGHGTGLGLSQVYGFVKQSGGHVKIYSEPGVGTTVKMYLPRFHSSVAPADPGPALTTATPKGSETILVVEDDVDVRTYTIETLKELGYIVIEAAEAQSALHRLDENPGIQVLFTDVGLPGGTNGRQLAEQARLRRRDLKVLFTTGYARNAIVHDGRLDPGVELITKPFTQAALAAKLRDIIDARSAGTRIMLVEDEPLIQMLAVGYLEEAGFKVDTATSAASALDKLRRIPGGVDALVVDIGLPDSSGDTLVREVRVIYPAVPIVVATGMGQDGHRRIFGDHRRISFLAKPYTAESLLAALQAVGIG